MEEGSSSESEWEEVKDGEEVNVGDAEEVEEEISDEDSDSDSERLSSGANVGVCEEYDLF